ncbi:hypothetical protein D3C73_599020 [compost metagenome]
MGRTGVLGAGEWHGLATARRCRWPVTADQALFGEIAENGLGAVDALLAPGVSHAAQFDGGGRARQGNIGFGKPLGQAQPGNGAGFVEGAAAGIFGQQRDLRTEACGQGLQAWPVLRHRIQQHDRFEVTVQVQHHIGVTGMLQQQAAQAVEFRGRCRHGGEGIAHGAAYECDVGVGIASQSAFQQRCNGIDQLREVAIEVLAAGELEAPLMGGLEHLGDTDRIGHGHQLDHSGQAALSFQFQQTALEFDGDAHPRQFVGMQ